MSDQNDLTGHPQGGIDQAPEDGSSPGTYGHGQTVGAPPGADAPGGSAGNREGRDSQR
jgi:hypothetical protein